METTSVKKNYIYNLSLTLANLFFPLITYTYASRILMPEGMGRASFAASVVSYFAMFAQLGIPTYGIRICAQIKNDRHKLSKTVKELFVINFLMSILAITALFLSILFSQRLYELRGLLLIYSITIIASMLEMAWLFEGLEQYEYITKRSLIIKSFSVIAIFILIKDKDDVPMYATVTAASSLITGIVNIVHSRKYIDVSERCKFDFVQHFKPVLVFFLMSVATSIYLNIDTVMLGFMTGDTEVGLYNSAVRIKTLLTGLITALGAVMLPRMSLLIAMKESNKFSEYIAKAMNYIFLISIPLVVYFVVYARECILLISGKAFAEATPSMMIIMPTLFFIGVTNILGIQILVPWGKEKYVLYSEIAGAITDVILNFVFIPQMGAAGAALGTLCAEMAVFISQITFLKSELKWIFREVSVKKMLTAVIVAFVALVLQRSFFTDVNVLVKVITSSLVFFGIYLLILVCEREQLVIEVKEGLKKYIKRQ